MAPTRTPAGVGARRVDGGDGGSGRKKLIPLLLVLLLLAVVAILLIALIGGDEGDEKDDRPAASGQRDVGRLTAGGARMLPRPSDVLSSHVGDAASGTNLDVTSVNGNEGFLVGSRAYRVYVEWGGDVGEDEPSRFQPRMGQKVDFTGPVERARPREVDRLKLSAEERNIVLSQGAFVNADRVSAAR